MGSYSKYPHFIYYNPSILNITYYKFWKLDSGICCIGKNWRGLPLICSCSQIWTCYNIFTTTAYTVDQRWLSSYQPNQRVSYSKFLAGNSYPPVMSCSQVESAVLPDFLVDISIWCASYDTDTVSYQRQSEPLKSISRLSQLEVVINWFGNWDLVSLGTLLSLFCELCTALAKLDVWSPWQSDQSFIESLWSFHDQLRISFEVIC